MRVMCVAIAALALAGCADLPLVNDQSCGNGVVDPGEDCDPHGDPACGAADDPVAFCRYLCSTDVELDCPDGYGCGNDDVCRKAEGVFEPMAPFQVPAERLTAGDVDGDGNMDIIGFGAAGVAGVYGETGGTFVDEIGLPINFTGLPDIGDVDGDGLLDFVAPYELGILVFRGDESRQLASAPFASFSRSSLESGLRVVVAYTGGAETSSEATLFAEGGMCFTSYCDVAGGGTLLPGTFQADDIVGEIAVGDVAAIGEDSDEMALSFSGDDRVFVYEQVVLAGAVRRWSLRQTIQLPDVVMYGARFVDVNDDGSLDVIASVRGGSAEVPDRVATSLWQPSDGTFGPADIDGRFDLFVLTGCGSGRRWPLAAGNFDGDLFTDYIGNAGVCRGQLVGFQLLAQPSIELHWNEALFDDFNADGLGDVAAAFEGTDGVDVFLGTGAGVFNRFNVDTDAPPIFLEGGDYNGDLVRDLSYVQRSGDHQTLVVAWGQRDGAPHTPTLMASFEEVEFVGTLPFVIPGVVSTLDAIDDAIVISRVQTPAGTKDYDITILMGSSSEQMISPYMLSEEGKLPFLTQVGQFTGTEHPDIFALGLQLPTDDAGAPPAGTLTIYVLVGSEAGFRPSEVLTMEYPADQEFAEGCSMVVSGDVNGDGLSEIVAVDNALVAPEAENVCLYDPHFAPGPTHRLAIAGLDVEGNVSMDVTTLGGSYAHRVRTMKLDDLDQDGADELIVVFAEESDGAKVVVYRNEGGIQPEPYELPIDGGLDAASLNFDGDALRDLAVLTTDGVFVFEVDGATFTRLGEEEVPAIFLDRISETDSRLLAADVTGDGLDDVLVTRGAQVFGFEAVEATRAAITPVED